MHKYFLILGCLILGFLAYTYYEYQHFNDHKLHVVFCDVGQGDAIFMRTPSGKNMLMDGGPDTRVLSCIQNHMPFWERSLMLVGLSHPHADHLNGLLSVFGQYQVRHFITEQLENKTDGYKKLQNDIKRNSILSQEVFLGDTVKMGDGVSLAILGPSKEFLARTSPQKLIGESKEFGSLVTLVTYGNFSVLLTGDSQVEGLFEAIQSISRSQIAVFQVPHHGSRFGTSQEILKRLAPRLAVISVGKNTYGHPSPKTITMPELCRYQS